MRVGVGPVGVAVRVGVRVGVTVAVREPVSVSDGVRATVAVLLGLSITKEVAVLVGAAGLGVLASSSVSVGKRVSVAE